jgi:membrane protein DedA with SNARE-associated domain
MLSWGPPVLLLAALINQIPVVSLFLPTEPVYLYIGTRLAAGEGWTALLACMLGAWIGSQGSFWLGRTAGAAVLARMDLAPAAMTRARALFQRHAALALVLSQLVWPIAKPMQVLAGAWGMRPLTFLLASGLGAPLAIAFYAAIGYGSAVGLAALGLRPEQSILAWLGPYSVLIGAVLLLMVGGGLIILRGPGAPALRAAYVALLALAMLAALNLGALMGVTAEEAPLGPVPPELACRALDETLLARAGPTPLHAIQPVNLVLVGIDEPNLVLGRLGWLRNRTYAANPPNPFDVLRLTLTGRPPAATIFLDGHATALAWQEESGTLPRVQLRLWRVETPPGVAHVYLGSVVQVDAVALRLSGRVPALTYDLFPVTDAARDATAAAFAREVPGATLALTGPTEAPFVEEGARIVVTDFRSDGLAAEVRAEGAPALAEICASL